MDIVTNAMLSYFHLFASKQLNLHLTICVQIHMGHGVQYIKRVHTCSNRLGLVVWCVCKIYT